MKNDRKYAIKKGMLDYILQDEDEQERLGVPVPCKVCQHKSYILNIWSRNLLLLLGICCL